MRPSCRSVSTGPALCCEANRNPGQSRCGVGDRRAPSERLAERGELLGRDRQPVRRLHQDLLHRVGAVVAGVRRQPVRGVVRTLVLVGGSTRGKEVGGVVRERQREVGRPGRSPFAPGVRQRHHVIDLHLGAGVRAAHELEQVPGVRVPQRAGRDQAGTQRVTRDVGQPRGEHVVTGVAAVPVDIGPRLAEELSPVALSRQRLGDAQPEDRLLCRGDPDRVDRCRRHRPHPSPPQRQHARDSGRQRDDDHGRRQSSRGRHVSRIARRPPGACRRTGVLWTTRHRPGPVDDRCSHRGVAVSWSSPIEMVVGAGSIRILRAARLSKRLVSVRPAA